MNLNRFFAFLGFIVIFTSAYGALAAPCLLNLKSRQGDGSFRTTKQAPFTADSYQKNVFNAELANQRAIITIFKNAVKVELFGLFDEGVVLEDPSRRSDISWADNVETDRAIGNTKYGISCQ